MYSQNQEEKVIKRIFESPAGNLKPGCILSIGENDGVTLSNSRALILAGWSAVLVEPDPGAFQRLYDLYNVHTRVKLFNFGIGDKTEKIPFWSSGAHLGNGDTGLLSTFDESELSRFPGTEWTKTEQDLVSWEDFYNNPETPKIYDAISIDAENYDLKILKLIDFNATQTKLVVVEWNSKNRHLYDQIMYPFGFRLVEVNGENLIYVR